MNFLKAEKKGAGSWQVAGCSFDGPRSGQEMLFAIRPEDLQPADNGLPADVKIVEPLGAHLLVTCDVAGQSFRAVLDSDLTLKPGDALKLAPMTDRIRWFDPATELSVA